MPMVVLKRRITVFLCEPEQRSDALLVAYLNQKNYAVTRITESNQAVEKIVTKVPDVVLLDARLPVAGGYEVCGMVRSSYPGHILLLSDDLDEASQLLAFERGADDYIPRPVSPALLTARINARLRRTHDVSGRSNGRQVSIGQLKVDESRREVFLAGQAIDLTTMQFELLWYLVKRSGRVVSREELYEALYQQKYNGFDRSVDVYVSRIRHQLGDDADKPSYLKTIRGVGYLFVGHDNSTPLDSSAVL